MRLARGNPAKAVEIKYLGNESVLGAYKKRFNYRHGATCEEGRLAIIKEWVGWVVFPWVRFVKTF